MTLTETVKEQGWNMEVELVFSPDHVLARTEHPIATSDGVILDLCRAWANLAREIIQQRIPGAQIADLAGSWSDW